jgi:colanic acid biosynthesis protein WcaH
MDSEDGWIPEAAFATGLRHMPQPCVDLVVAHDGGVLLARRTNEPAAGEWFWPGSRLLKGERLDDAVDRIAAAELGLTVADAERLGVSEHFWESTSVPGVDRRHTVVVVYRVTPAPPVEVTLDDQHDGWRILREPEADCHEYVREYVDRFDLLD